ncbi:MAG TPA: hypothetical protein VH302_10555 [Bryobacteraceae bacterium]|nr:hypothetical protein [Bryobacteraceae bacterium]
MPKQLSPADQMYRHPLWLLVGFWVCVVIAIAVVIRRILALTEGSNSGTGPMAEMNAAFSSHAALTMAHIVPAMIFVLLAVAVLFRVGRGKWLQPLFFAFGAITGLTAYAMNAYAIGGWTERSAVLAFDTWFLVSLSFAFRFYLRGDAGEQRAWSTRAIGILLGIATTRPVMGVFFATSSRTHLSPHEFFGVAFWIGFSINALVIELWLHSRRRAQLNNLYSMRTLRV